MAYSDMPDVGTLGGTMQDAYGESSATTGTTSPEQQTANQDIYGDPWGYDFSDLGSMYTSPSLYGGSGYNYGGPSTGVYGNPSSPNTTAWGQMTSTVDDFFQNNKFGKIAGMALNFTPVGRAFNIARGINSAMGKGDYMSAGANMLGAVNPALGGIAQAGLAASRGNYGPGGGMLAGNLVGAATNNPVAGQLAGMVGNYVGNQASRGGGGGSAGPNGPQGPQGEQGGGFDLPSLVSGLTNVYGAAQGLKTPSGVSAGNDAVQQQIQNLSQMYSTNSPYAQQLRQALERKDAAAGRRSQYGPREVQLMAALADKQAGVSESIGRLATSNQANQTAMQDRKRLAQGQTLSTIMNLADRSGALRGLQGMFNQQPAASPQPQAVNYPTEDTTAYESWF